jgi:hypothetical protein
VYTGTGAVWENPTCGIPVFNPSEFITGSLEDVKKNVDIAELDDDYKNPTETLPIPPPPQCNQNECGKCKSCNAIRSWQTQFDSTVDDILFRSNLHRCTGGIKQHEKKNLKYKDKNTVNKYQPVTGCLSHKWGKCKAHFPRKTFEHTEVDMDTWWSGPLLRMACTSPPFVLDLFTL